MNDIVPQLKISEATSVRTMDALLGEGPLWDTRSATLWFVDIKQGRLHHFDPTTGGCENIEIGGRPCFIVPSDDGGFLVGDGNTLHRFNGSTVIGTYATLAMPGGNRLNDGTVDCAGRLWFGSMDDAEQEPSGEVYCYDRGVISRMGGNCIITNGPAITSDGRLLYHVDTVDGTIWRFRLDGRQALRDGILFARIDPMDGHPDGVTIDAEEHVWVGLWGGWQARRYAPDGRLVQIVRFPCSLVTKIAFGGPDLKTGYATTARVGLDEAALTAQPLAGALFAFPVDVAGIAMPEVRLAPPA